MTEKQCGALIVTIVNRGFSEEVVEASKEAGAGGGTIVHGLGSGSAADAKLFGVAIMPEKDIVLTVVAEEKKHGVMTAIHEKVGLNEKGKGIVFSLPVNDVVGTKNL